MKSYRLFIGLLGLFLGFGAPLGALVFRSVVAGQSLSADFVVHELRYHDSFYIYMGMMTPLVLASFGIALGGVLDQFFLQRSIFQKQSILDDLTGLYNRRQMTFEIEKEVERARRYRHPVAGMMIDIDDFKKINDKYGHLAGDRVLREAAFTFEQSVRKIDIVGRYGGDEFIILLPESTQEIARVVAERIQKGINGHEFVHKNKPLKVSVSIGTFFFQDLTEIDKSAFIEAVDRAMFEAKTQGKNCIVSSSGAVKA